MLALANLTKTFGEVGAPEGISPATSSPRIEISATRWVVSRRWSQRRSRSENAFGVCIVHRPIPANIVTLVAYDEDLAARIRGHVGNTPGVVEKKMFGGVAFMLSGNMAVGVSGDELMVRMGERAGEEALGEPGVRPFDKSGRPMKGWVLVAPEAISEDSDFTDWVGIGLDYARSLPAK